MCQLTLPAKIRENEDRRLLRFGQRPCVRYLIRAKYFGPAGKIRKIRHLKCDFHGFGGLCGCIDNDKVRIAPLRFHKKAGERAGLDLKSGQGFIMPLPSPLEPLHHTALTFRINQNNLFTSPNRHLSHVNCQCRFTRIVLL